MGSPSTYSFKDLLLAFNDPDVGPFNAAGELGFGELIIAMTTERVVQSVAADGTVMITYIAGNNGSADFQVQQVSALHIFLLNWANTKFTNADNGSLTTFASASFTARNVVDGTQHVCTGVTPTKIPDKTYASQGGLITWRLMVADSRQTTVS